MSATVQVLAVLYGVALVLVWVMESFLWRDPRFFRLLRIAPEDHDAVRLWTVSVGYYNLTCAVALFIGVWLLNRGHEEAGEALVLFTATQHGFLAVVMLVVDQRMWLNSVMEATIPVVILALALT